jgi:hypothetical protein
MFDAIEIFFKLAAVVGGPLLAVMVVPPLAKRILRASPSAPSADVEALAQRVAELEERVDFAERLLAQQRDALPRPRA